MPVPESSPSSSSSNWWDTYKGPIGKGDKAGYEAASARTDAIKKNNILGFEAQQYANQAAIAGYQAQLDQQAGALRVQNAQLQTAGQFGASRARLAASGIDLGQGSATDVLASTEYMGERQAMTIRDDTNRQVWQDQVQQYQDQQQARLSKMQMANPDMAAFKSMLGSAASFAITG